MCYRDHINFSMFLLTGSLFILRKGVSPLLRSFDGIFTALLLSAFLAGVSFPDVDTRFYAQGHRVRSPLHNLSCATAAFAASLALRRFLSPPFGLALPAFALGWVCHLLGDAIQGGISVLPGSRRRFGISWLDWDRYANSAAGHGVSLLVFLGGLAGAGWWGMTYHSMRLAVLGVYSAGLMHRSYRGGLFTLTLVCAGCMEYLRHY